MEKKQLNPKLRIPRVADVAVATLKAREDDRSATLAAKEKKST